MERGRRLRPIRAPESTFSGAIEHLLQNAIKCASGGVVAVDRTAEFVRISVRDVGPGIPANDRDRLLRAFERGESSRNGHTCGASLGLSIVRDFATRNRRTSTLSDAPGGGTLATLELSAA